MKEIRITYKAVVDDEQVKTNGDIIDQGIFEDLEDAILTDGLDGVISGSYSYNVEWEIKEMECE